LLSTAKIILTQKSVFNVIIGHENEKAPSSYGRGFGLKFLTLQSKRHFIAAIRLRRRRLNRLPFFAWSLVTLSAQHG
jgi:hypothetical protein